MFLIVVLTVSLIEFRCLWSILGMIRRKNAYIFENCSQLLTAIRGYIANFSCFQAFVALFGLVAAASAGGLLAGHGFGYAGHGFAPIAPLAVQTAPIVAPVAVHAGYARAHSYSSAINHGAIVGKTVHALAYAAPLASYGHGIGLAHGYGGFGYGAKLW